MCVQQRHHSNLWLHAFTKIYFMRVVAFQPTVKKKTTKHCKAAIVAECIILAFLSCTMHTLLVSFHTLFRLCVCRVPTVECNVKVRTVYIARAICLRQQKLCRAIFGLFVKFGITPESERARIVYSRAHRAQHITKF